MTVRYMRLSIIGTNQTKLSNIKTWLEGKIIDNDFSSNINSKGVFLVDKLDGTYELSMALYIKKTISVNKYKNIIVDEFTKLDKSGISSAEFIQYDNCDHDSDNPSPCIEDKRFEWVK